MTTLFQTNQLDDKSIECNHTKTNWQWQRQSEEISSVYTKTVASIEGVLWLAMSSASNLWTTWAEFAPKNIVIIAGINELK